ncbi:hypothetical protein FAUST_10139, partial [Fusarium austroamericanum]
MAASVEINDTCFCQEHFAEVCEECNVDFREENDAFYGFDSRDRDALTCPPASVNNDGVVVCNEHDSAISVSAGKGRSPGSLKKPQS